MMQVFDDLDEYILSIGYDVRCFGYDPYNAKEFVERWSRENGPFGIEKVIQGTKTESVPLGELKKLSEERMLLFDEKLMTFFLLMYFQWYNSSSGIMTCLLIDKPYCFKLFTPAFYNVRFLLKCFSI